MGVDEVTAIVRRRNSAFAGLVSATLGLILMESANVFLKGSVTAHVVCLAIGAALVSLMLRSLLKNWPSAPRASGGIGLEKAATRSSMVNVAACAVIAYAGYAASTVLLGGFVTPLFLFVVGLVLLPWQKIACSPAQYLACWTAVVAGVAGTLLLHDNVAFPLLLLASALQLWLLTIACWVLATFHKPVGRKAASKELA